MQDRTDSWMKHVLNVIARVFSKGVLCHFSDVVPSDLPFPSNLHSKLCSCRAHTKDISPLVLGLLLRSFVIVSLLHMSCSADRATVGNGSR